MRGRPWRTGGVPLAMWNIVGVMGRKANKAKGIEEGPRGERAYFGARAPLELGFDFPGQRRLAIFVQEDIVAFGVDVLGVYEEAVHIEETGADFRESRSCSERG